VCAWRLAAVCEFVEFVVVEHSDLPVKVPERVADLIGQLAGMGGAVSTTDGSAAVVGMACSFPLVFADTAGWNFRGHAGGTPGPNFSVCTVQRGPPAGFETCDTGFCGRAISTIAVRSRLLLQDNGIRVLSGLVSNRPFASILGHK
jgi:hypothetical protein